MVSRRIPSAKQDLSDRAISYRKKGPQDNACALTRSGWHATPKPFGTATGQTPLRIHRFYRDKGIQKREGDGTGNAAQPAGEDLCRDRVQKILGPRKWRRPHQPHPGTRCSRCDCCLLALTRWHASMLGQSLRALRGKGFRRMGLRKFYRANTRHGQGEIRGVASTVTLCCHTHGLHHQARGALLPGARFCYYLKYRLCSTPPVHLFPVLCPPTRQRIVKKAFRNASEARIFDCRTARRCMHLRRRCRRPGIACVLRSAVEGCRQDILRRSYRWPSWS